ncbi:MAG: hypothetical protein Kow00105_12730 [Phycisphaeraceae bacterium]
MTRILLIRGYVLLLLLISGWVRPTLGQIHDVVLEVDREHIGLGEYAKPGMWTPIFLTIDNRAAEPRRVICRWVLADGDGDRVHAERTVTLNAQSEQGVWLYGPLPVGLRHSEPWRVQVLDDTGEVLLNSIDIPPARYVNPNDRIIGVMGRSDLGLGGYADGQTTHEKIQLVTDMSLSALPDRWYGLESTDILIWTKDGGDPTDPAVTPEMQRALRNWIRRGGHLVLMLPAYGQTWTGSGMADLLPVKAEQIRRVEGRPPSWLGAIRSDTVQDVAMTVFDLPPDHHMDVIRQYETFPVIIAKRYGFGRVTLIGLDLTDYRFSRMGLPNGRYPLWRDVFSWQSPVYEQAYIDAEIDNNAMSRADQRRPIQADRFIPGQVSMRGKAAPALLLAILLFGLYWLTAGPMSLVILKRRGAVRHSWVVFVLVVIFFSGLCWAGAWLMSPGGVGVSHFTVVTAVHGQRATHAHSWLSLYVPGFTGREVSVDPDQPQARNTLASPGWDPSLNRSVFLDPQAYTIDVSTPRTAVVPFRSTAKQFEVDFLGRVDQEKPGLIQPIVMPQGAIRLENKWPVGKLSHGLPVPMRDVLFVYCPGDGQTPWVWRLADPWPPGEVIELQPGNDLDLLVRLPGDRTYTERRWAEEGYLGKLIRNKPGEQWIDDAGELIIAPSTEMIQLVELLTFYDTLPPPDFRQTGFPYPTVLRRHWGRHMDLTRMTTGRRLIVIGHLEASPLPIPLTVEGETVPSEGWAVVRWIYDL